MANETSNRYVLPPGPGRPKGSVNKSTASVKAALQEAFEGMGGVEALKTWGKDNPQLFYPIWSKLLPTEMHVSDMRDVKQMDDAELDNQRRALKIA